MQALLQAVSVLVALALTWVSPAIAVSGVPDEPSVEGPREIAVSMRDNRFHPARLMVAAGATVVWSNDELDETIEHNVISRDYRWASSNFFPGETYQHTFTIPGTYRYFCDLHGGMVGQIVVE
jgi:plastocyanin